MEQIDKFVRRKQAGTKAEKSSETGFFDFQFDFQINKFTSPRSEIQDLILVPD